MWVLLSDRWVHRPDGEDHHDDHEYAGTTVITRAERTYDPADVSSREFWSLTATGRERTFAELRANRPVSWHRPAEDLLVEDPNDQGFWAVVRHADLVEVTRRHGDFLSG